jgi:Protein of unknown function (DUF2274)
MSKLKLDAIEDDKPVRLAIDLPAPVHRDLVVYAEALGQATGSWRRIEPSRSFGGHGQSNLRDRASSRMNATNLPTAGSSVVGCQASST